MSVKWKTFEISWLAKLEKNYWRKRVKVYAFNFGVNIFLWKIGEI